MKFSVSMMKKIKYIWGKKFEKYVSLFRGMRTRFIYNQCVRRAPCNLSCNSCTISDQEQTAPVCVTPAAVWPLSVRQGPTRWASRSSNPPSLLDSLAGRPSKCPALHSSPLLLQCLAWETQKYLPCTHQACFSKPCLTVVRKTTPPLPSLHCSVSRGQPVTGRHVSKPPDVKTVLTSLSWKDFFGSYLIFL